MIIGASSELSKVPEVTIDKCKLAIQRMEQRISSFYEPLVKAITGKTIKVLPHPTSSSTDGRRVYLAVPLVLGEDTEHIKNLCGQRDPETKWMKCPACAVTDELDSNVYHEVCGHICFDSFMDVEPEVKKKAFQFLLMKKVEEADPDRVDEVLANINAHAKSAMQVAHAVDCWLPLITNMIEDIYVNQSMYQERPGTWEPMFATDYLFLTRGMRNIGDVNHPERTDAWSGASPDSRAIMCLYVMANKFDFARPLVGADMSVVLDDPRIQEAVSMQHVLLHENPGSRLELALQIQEYLRELGFCIDPRSFVFKPPPIVIEMTREEYDSLDKSDEPDPEDSPIIIKIIDPPPSEDEGESDDDDEEGEGEGSGESDEESDDDDAESDSSSGPGESNDEESDDEADGAGDDESEDDESEDGGGSGESSDDDDDDSEDGGAEMRPSSTEGDEEGEWKPMDHDADPIEAGDASDDVEHGKGDSGSHKTLKSVIDEAKEEAEAKADQAARDAEEAASILEDFTGHGDDGDKPETHAEEIQHELVELILDQRDHFDTLSFGVTGVTARKATVTDKVNLKTAPPYNKIMPSLGPLRVAFTVNRKRGTERSLEKGPKIDARHLYRIKTDDSRWHAKRNIPKRRDWSVLIGCDNSGSTGGGGRIQTIASGAYAMSELLAGVGIPFSVFSHSGSSSRLWIDEIKDFADPWDDTARRRCLAQTSRSSNLDGHTLEYYRRHLERERSTDKLLLYVTDGAMPCENYDEELEILQRNIKYCMAHGIYLVGIGVLNDEPKKYGLDMIRYDSLSDLPFLVSELAKRLEM